MSANTVYLIYGSAYTSGTRHVVHVRNPTCRQKVLDNKKSAMFSAAWWSIIIIIIIHSSLYRHKIVTSEAVVPVVQHIRKRSIIATVLWTSSSERSEFHRFTVMVRVSRISSIMVSVRSSDMFSFSNRQHRISRREVSEIIFWEPDVYRHSLNFYIHPQALAVFEVLASATGSSAVLS